MMHQVATAVKLFPLVLPIWLERPLEDEDIRPGPYPIEVSQEEILMQREALGITDDYNLRCHVVKHLRQTREQAAFAVLVDHLGKEKNPRVIATIAQQLCAMPFRSAAVASKVRPLLSHPDPDVRSWASRLYGETPEAELTELMRRALEDDVVRVREAACVALGQHARSVKVEFFSKLWQDPVPPIRAEALLAALRKPEAVTFQADFLEACDDDSPVVRYRLAAGMDRVLRVLQPLLAAKLVTDSHASVRGAAADAMGRIGAAKLLPVLLRLEQDPDPEVRRLTAKNLAMFPEPPAREALVRLLADPRSLVQFRTAESLVALDRRIPVQSAVAARLDDEIVYVRFHVYRILGRLEAKQYEQQIFRQLSRETIPRNIGTALFALGQFESRFAADRVAELGEHESPIVREEAARALGRLLVPGTYQVIKKLLFDGEEDVRQAAFVAAGRTGDGNVFNECIPKALRIFNGREMTSKNRGAACWCAARLRPVSGKVISRLVTQGTTPVVPCPPGPPEFEEDRVLVSIAFALAQCGRDNPTAKERAKYVLAKHSYKAPQGMLRLPTGTTVFSAEVQEYARQARAFLEGKEVKEKMPRPTRHLSFDYGRYEAPPTY